MSDPIRIAKAILSREPGLVVVVEDPNGEMYEIVSWFIDSEKIHIFIDKPGASPERDNAA